MVTTTIDLAAVVRLEQLEKGGSAAPWVATKMGAVWSGELRTNTRGETRGANPRTHGPFTVDPSDYYHLNQHDAEEQAEADRDLIAETRTALPGLLASARRLLELESAMTWCAGRGFDLGSPETFLEECKERGWPGLPQPEVAAAPDVQMCDHCEDDPATCFHEEEGGHLCDDCCDHSDGCKPLETRP